MAKTADGTMYVPDSLLYGGKAGETPCAWRLPHRPAGVLVSDDGALFIHHGARSFLCHAPDKITCKPYSGQPSQHGRRLAVAFPCFVRYTESERSVTPHGPDNGAAYFAPLGRRGRGGFYTNTQKMNVWAPWPDGRPTKMKRQPYDHSHGAVSTGNLCRGTKETGRPVGSVGIHKRAAKTKPKSAAGSPCRTGGRGLSPKRSGGYYAGVLKNSIVKRCGTSIMTLR